MPSFAKVHLRRTDSLFPLKSEKRNRIPMLRRPWRCLVSKSDIYGFVASCDAMPFFASIYRRLDTQRKRKRVLVGANSRIPCPPLHLDRC